MRRGWACWVAGWARPVSDKLWPAGGLLVGLGLSLVSDTSDRPGQQEVMLFRTKKHFLVIFAIVSTFSTKMDSWSWTPTNPENVKARRTGFWARRHGLGGVGGGGGPAKFWLGKSEDSLWRRDLSALGPCGAEANLIPR